MQPTTFTPRKSWRLRGVFAYSLTLLIALGSPVTQAEESLSEEEIADMQAAMEEAQAAMEELDPETRQQMADVMKQFQAANPPSSNNTPKNRKDVLAKIDKSPMSPAKLKAFINELQPKLEAAVSSEIKRRANKVDSELKKFPDYQERLRAAINGLAAIGAWPEAVYLSARLSSQTGNTQDLSNLAAFLTMLQAEPAALPILHTLHSRYPSNSTLLNNLGQAYYQMGDSKKAEEFLVAAVKLSPKHPQANMTRSLIQQANGDSAAAQASAHNALQGGFSKSKEEQLRKSGGKITHEDVQWRRPMPADPLGIGSLRPSVYPEKPDQLPAIIALMKKNNAEVDAQAQTYQNRAAQLPAPNLAQAAATLFMPFSQQATKLMELEAKQTERNIENKRQRLVDTRIKAAEGKNKLEQAIREIDAAGMDKYRGVAGGYQFDYTCNEVKGAIQSYLNEAVPLIRETEGEMADLIKHDTNRRAYLLQFILPATEFERAQLQTKASLKQHLVGAPEVVSSLEGIVNQRRLACWSGEPKKQNLKLRNYNDIRCEYITHFSMPGFGEWTVRCDKTTVSFDSPFVPFEAAWTTQNTGRGAEEMLIQATAAISIEGVKIGGHSEFDEKGWKSGGIEVGVEVDVGPKVLGGPLEIGVTANITGTIEFDRSGVTDVGVSGQLGTKASSTFAQTEEGGHIQSTLESNASSSWSWNAGFNGDSSTSFEGSVFDTGEVNLV